MNFSNKHILCTSNSSQNFIVDLLINLGQHLENNIEKLKQLVIELGQFFEISNINILMRNLNYIKEILFVFN